MNYNKIKLDLSIMDLDLKIEELDKKIKMYNDDVKSFVIIAQRLLYLILLIAVFRVMLEIYLDNTKILSYYVFYSNMIVLLSVIIQYVLMGMMFRYNYLCKVCREQQDKLIDKKRELDQIII